MPLPSDGQQFDTLPPEFDGAIELEKFHKYAIAVEDDGNVTVYFALADKSGKTHSFKSDGSTMRAINIQFEQLGGIATEIKVESGGSADFPFETEAIAVVGVQNRSTGGHLLLEFITPTGPNLQTEIGPELAEFLASRIDEALASIARPPRAKQTMRRHTHVAGGGHTKGETVTYFGQEFRANILQGLGVLVVRANLLERALVEALAAVTAMPVRQASALFYSTANMKARIDLIWAATSFSALEDGIKQHILEHLDRASGVVGRRNNLVHAQWEFKDDKFRLQTWEPNKVNPEKTWFETARSIEALAEDYRAIGVGIEIFASSIARNTSSTPDSGQPKASE